MPEPIAVVIATFNRPDLLSRCLDSIADQSHPAASVVVVDDGSTCDLAEVRARFAGRLPLRWLRHSGGGVGAARNLAALVVREPWTCVMDDDDVMLPDRLLAHARHVADGSLDVSYGGWINFEQGRSASFYPGKAYSDAALILEGGVLTHGAATIRTELLRANPYDETLLGGTDFDLFARLAEAQARFGHCGEYVIYRRLHDYRIGGTDALRTMQRDTRRRTVERLQTAWRGRNPLEKSDPAPPPVLAMPDLSAVARTCAIDPPFVLELTVSRSLADCRPMLRLLDREGLEGRFASERPDAARVFLQVPFASWSDQSLADLVEEAGRGALRFALRRVGSGSALDVVRLRGRDGRPVEQRFGSLRELIYMIDGQPDSAELRLVG